MRRAHHALRAARRIIRLRARARRSDADRGYGRTFEAGWWRFIDGNGRCRLYEYECAEDGWRWRIEVRHADGWRRDQRLLGAARAAALATRRKRQIAVLL
jgi:hypothetical protein